MGCEGDGEDGGRSEGGGRRRREGRGRRRGRRAEGEGGRSTAGEAGGDGGEEWKKGRPATERRSSPLLAHRCGEIVGVYGNLHILMRMVLDATRFGFCESVQLLDRDLDFVSGRDFAFRFRVVFSD